MASQIPNLPAGFKNNIAPQPATQVYLPETGIQEIVTNNDSIVDTISIFGQVFQKKYFYLFTIVILGVVGYFLWKWYFGKNKNKKDDESEEDGEYDEDDENDEQQALMEQMMMQEMMKQQTNKEN